MYRSAFVKEYTRDTTLIIQQAWCVALEAHRKELGLREYDEQILVLHYLHDGVVEVWENTGWDNALADKILELNKAGEAQFNEHIKKHLENVEYLKPLWEKGFTKDLEELVSFIDKVFESMYFFDWMYFPAVDDRTPQNIRTKALKLRDEDVHFDSTDKFIRNSLVAIYPNLKGYEQGILRSEITTPPALEVLKERKKNFVISGEKVTFQGSLEEYQAKHPELNFILEQPLTENTVISGQIGSKGYAQGIVRILKRKEQITEAQEGDVIVSTMTTPDFVLAMQKAAAIVTDEGGITCHAAIVARELGKPCIIGTKFATQLLKDGDVVEVDANEGVVRMVGTESKKKAKWVHYLTRPFTLFGSSLWYTWYAEYAQRLVDKDISDMLSVEESLVVVRNYRRKENLDYLTKTIGELARDNPAKCNEMLDKGLEYNKLAQAYFSKSSEFKNFKDAVEFYFEASLYATVLPHFVMLGLESLSVENKELLEKSQELRSSSLYPKLLSDIVTPKAVEELSSKGVKDPEQSVELLLVDELLAGDFSNLEYRKRMRIEGKLYAYEVVGRTTTINWYDSTKHIIQELEGMDLSGTEFKGQVAYKGKVTGTARIIKSIDGKGEVFNDGDILVSINSNPNLMPIIQKAAAIITEEGGITCHAAIISRELKIPCIIGTKIATQTLKNGDLVEVDADNGIIKILK